MKQYNVTIERGSSAKATLPAGLYEVKIIQAKVETSSNGSPMLVLAYDIAEGEYKDFYKKDFDSRATDANRKWRGTFRLFLPKEDGSDQDARNSATLGHALWAIEDSNEGFHFDWDEKHLVGKTVGINVRNKEYDYNGIQGWTTECGKLESVKDIRDGRAKVMRDRALKRVSTSGDFFGAPPAQNGGYQDFGGAPQEEYPF